MLAAAIFMLLSTTILFNVEHITVTGSSNYTSDEIIAASGLIAGDNLIRTNTGKTASNIEKKLVHVEKATVTRSFPSTLVIDVEPCVPAANFICGNTILLISKGGKILEQIDEPKAELLNFTGTEPKAGLLPGDFFESEDEHKTDVVYQLMKYCLEHNDKTITMVDVTDRAELSYTYDKRITVKIGSINDLSYKMNFSKEIIETRIGENTEGLLTILSDSNRASFLDKETLEHNEQVFMENDPKKADEEESEDGEDEENEDDNISHEASDIDPFME